MRKGRNFIWICAVVVLLLALALASCEGKDENGIDSGIDGAGVELIQNGEACIKIYYAKQEKDLARDGMNLLISRFEKSFGVTLEKPAPWTGDVGDAPCVVFGNVGDETSEAVYSEIRFRDCAIRVEGNRVYVAALQSDLYGQAINSLMQALTENASEDGANELVLKEDYSFFQKGRYSLNQVEIDGTEMKKFMIMEPKDSAITSTVTQSLVDAIYESYGYELPRKMFQNNGEHAIILKIDKSVGEMNYGYKIENGDLVIQAGGAYSMFCATREVASLLRQNGTATNVTMKEGDQFTVSLLNNPEGLAKAENSNLRIMSCNVLANGFDPAFKGWSDTGEYTFEMRTEVFEKFLEVYAPDVVGMQEVCPSWYEFFDSYLEGNSAWKLSNASEKGKRPYYLNPILYRADKYRLVEEGFFNYTSSFSQAWGGRYMGWAVLESLENGQRFVVINCHWDGWSNHEKNAVQVQETLAKIKEMQDKYQCQVLVTGDFNTRDVNPETNEPDIDYTAFLEDGTIKDGKYYTEYLVESIGSLHGYGETAYPRVYSFDHIFVTNETVIRQFKTAWDNHQNFASDHAFLVADIDLSTKVSS